MTHRSVTAGFLFFIGQLIFYTAPAAALSLEGKAVQGGMLIGRVEPGDQVLVDSNPVRVSEEGVFLVGFDRSAPAETTIQVKRNGRELALEKVQVAKREYDIQRIDGLPPSKVTPSQADLKRIKDERAQVQKARQLDAARTDFLQGFIWPLEGRISGVYGSQRILNGEARTPHYGVDVAAPTGTLVVAPAPGLVTLAHNDMFYSGGTLIIDHGHNLSSSFLHLSKILVKSGDRVNRGDPIAEVGATGRVTGPHLDWRMNLHAAHIDPQLLVPPMPTQKTAAATD